MGAGEDDNEDDAASGVHGDDEAADSEPSGAEEEMDDEERSFKREVSDTVCEALPGVLPVLALLGMVTPWEQGLEHVDWCAFCTTACLVLLEHFINVLQAVPSLCNALLGIATHVTDCNIQATQFGQVWRHYMHTCR